MNKMSGYLLFAIAAALAAVLILLAIPNGLGVWIAVGVEAYVVGIMIIAILVLAGWRAMHAEG